MNRSPLASTFLVFGFGIGVPIALTRRLADGLFPLGPSDLALAFGIAAWIFVARAILDRDEPMHSVIENRLSPSWQAHSLVEQSLLGVGYNSGGQLAGQEPRLYLLQSIPQSVDALLPPPVQTPTDGWVRDQAGDARAVASQPILVTDEHADSPILETEEYTVERGDTFWSIAEARLGDGRRWKEIEALNTGREVATDILFATGNDLRIGWSILAPIPLDLESEE